MSAVMKAEKKQIEWFDLSRFGVALRVMPHSPLRGSALTCLEVRDQDQYHRVLGWYQGISDEERRTIRETLNDTLRALDFDLTPSYVRLPDNTTVTRLFSTRQSLTLRDIKRLVPGAEPSDRRAMPLEEVAIIDTIAPQATVAWEGYLQESLKAEAVGVWVPRDSAFDKPWAEAGSIEAIRLKQGEHHRLLDRIESGFIPDKLVRAGYRQNALVGFYATREAAVADGHAVQDLEQVDLPYAAPLWVTRGNQVIAVRDVRYAPEVMGMLPELVYGHPHGGLVVPALRAVEELVPWLEQRMGDWLAWAADPTQLVDRDAIWQSFNEAVVKLNGVAEAHGKLRQVDTALKDYVGDGEAAEGLVRTIPLDQMDARYAQNLAYQFRAYTGFADEAMPGLRAAITTIIERGHGLMAEAAMEAARTALQVTAETLKDSDPVISTEAVTRRHEDVGVKIGGARKDFAKRAMVVDDLEYMNAAERSALVNKGNVWPALNYEAMRERGVTAHAAMAIKVLKDSLATSPYQRVKDRDRDADYIRAIGLVRDHMADVKTLDDFNQAMVALYDAGLDTPNEPRSRKVYSTPMQWQWGMKAAQMINDGSDRYGDGVVRLPQKIGVTLRRKVGPIDNESEGSWENLIRTGKAMTQEEKEARATKQRLEAELHRPHLDKVQRVGTDWRNGRDMDANDLMTHFGARAIEFGNWLPQDERQQVINMAFDSLMDLSQALDLPPKALSLGGSLALAFGSRGQGGAHAALAHFEPARNVINLTRMNGAGALAHEWMHGLDCYLSGTPTGFASEREASSTVMGKLARGLREQPMTLEELDAKTTANLAKSARYIASWMRCEKAPQEALVVQVETEIEAMRATFYEQAVSAVKRTMQHHPDFAGAGLDSYGAVSRSEQVEQVDALMERLKERHPDRKVITKHKAQIEANVMYMVRNLAANCTIDAVRDLNAPVPGGFTSGNARPTKFMEDAKKLDQTRSEEYWSTTRELFARAGAAYVYDRLKALDVRSDYLVYGSDEGRYSDHALGNPNPGGEDRQRFAELFDDLIADYRMRCVADAERTAAKDAEVTGLEP